MPKTAVLIPSRNEFYLNQTIQSCFDNAAGDLEVVVCLEGYWPSDWKDITARYPNLHTIHHGEPRGLRAAINSAAGSAISRGADYLFKLDAHCMLDQRYDLKLLADIQPNWIVIPRRKRLDAENWTIQDVGKPDVDYHYLSFPDDPNDFGGPGLNGKVWDERIRQRLGKPEYDIDDEMASQGSAWCMASSYFQELELMDETSYGKFWNESQELLLKCWLSGGRGVINKKTWYAHLHKSRNYKGLDGKSGRGYRLPESWLTQGRNHTMKWIWNEAWAKQTLPFKWLIEHFWPVPGWPEDWEEKLYAERKPRAVSGYTEEKQDGMGVKADDYAVKQGLRIHSARYGIGMLDNSVDVTETLRSLVKDNSLDIVVNNSTLTPGQNPYRGKKKSLWVTYSYNGNEPQTHQRGEKDWLIIGQGQRDTGSRETAEFVANRDGRAEDVQPDTLKHLTSYSGHRVVNAVIDLNPPRTAPALNDYLIRKFSISDRRLRAPMPIELRDFHRDGLARLFAELGFNKGCEVGVAEANFSEIILKANPDCSLLLVDPWHSYSSNPQNKSKEKHEYAYNETLRKTAPYPNVKIDMRYSMDAVRDVPDRSLDFVYLDGHHSYPFIMSDLIFWSQKVRSGGIVSGDDVYKLDEARWGAGPAEAVYDYTRAMRINPWFLIDAHKSVDFFFIQP